MRRVASLRRMAVTLITASTVVVPKPNRELETVVGEMKQRHVMQADNSV